MLCIVIQMRMAAIALNHHLMSPKVIWQFMLDQSFGGLSFPLPILATPCSRCCWKRLRRSSGLIIVARSPYHAILRLSSSLLSAWRPIRRLTLIRVQVRFFNFPFLLSITSPIFLSLIVSSCLVDVFEI